MKLSRGEKFVEARKIHNRHGKQTQGEVYAATGIPASKIKDLEDDDKTRGVDYRAIVKLAEYYGVSLDYLIGSSDDPRPEPSQKAAATYLGLSDYETRVLAKVIGGSHFKHSLFKKMLSQHILENILGTIESAAHRINVQTNALNDENVDITRYEVRHIQRDLGEDIEHLLSPVTGLDSINYQIKTITQKKNQEYAFEEYKTRVEDLKLWKEAPDGEHQED